MIEINGFTDKDGKPFGYVMPEDEKEIPMPESKPVMTEGELDLLATIRFNSLFDTPMSKETEVWLLSKFQEVLDENRMLLAVKDGLICGLMKIRQRIESVSRGGSLRF